MPTILASTMDAKFVKQAGLLRVYLHQLKEEFNAKGAVLNDERKESDLLNARKTVVFPQLDIFFDSLWAAVKDMSPERYQEHKDYFEKELFSYLADGIESNSYIREQPLGYAGDYVMMCMIYDYHQSFFGKTLYSKLINHYTCNIDVARSNIYRKEYLQKKIMSYAAQKEPFQILSVGCGPARELIELLKSKQLVGPVTIHLLDLEKNAIFFVKQELAKIDFDREMVVFDFHMLDLIEIVKSRRIKDLFSNVDLIYVSGVFDYLSDRIATRVLKGMLEVAKKELVVFNMSLENARHRIYYEMFGHWVMYHRRKEEILRWSEFCKDTAQVSVSAYPGCNSYWVLDIRKV